MKTDRSDNDLSPELWQEQVLENLERTGPICRGVAGYLRARQVEIGLARALLRRAVFRRAGAT